LTKPIKTLVTPKHFLDMDAAAQAFESVKQKAAE